MERRKSVPLSIPIQQTPGPKGRGMGYFGTQLRVGLSRMLLWIFHVQVSYSDSSIKRFQKGQVLVYSNHVSLIDGLLIALASPVPLVFAVDTAYSRHSPIARYGMAILTMFGFGRIIPIDSKYPFGMRALYRAMLEGESVMIFPEGRISKTGESLPMQPGIEWLRSRCYVPEIQVSIRGAERSRLFAKRGNEWWPRITLSFSISRT